MRQPRAPARRPPLPPGWDLTVVGPNKPGGHLTRDQLTAAVNGGGWDHRRPTLFVVNDRQRATPSALLLSLIDPPLAEWPRATFIVATGSHRPPDRRELAAIFGRALLPAIRGRIIVHDARDPALAAVGHTTRGTPVAVHPALFENQAVVAVGSAEPHYFAGVTGGRKSLVPGLASFETIRWNHRLALERGARALTLDGNPVHGDLEEACGLVLREAGLRGAAAVESLTVVHQGRRVTYVDRGPVPGAARRALPAVEELFTRPVAGRFPVVTAEPGYPLDRDFYQALKAFEHGRRVLAPGGVLVLDAACPRGLGPEHFVRLIEGIGDPRHFAPDFSSGYDLGAQKVVNLLEHLRGGMQLFLVTPGGPSRWACLERLGVRMFGSLREALIQAAQDVGEKRRMLLVREAGTVVPRITRADAGSS